MAVVVSKDNVRIGMLVYQYGYPTNPGVIRKIINIGLYRVYCEVEWLKATRTRPKITQTQHLNDFESLIEDHARKFKSQTELARKLRNMP